MYPNDQHLSCEHLLREIQELEDSYAQALGDEADANTLSNLWHRIKLLNREMEQRERIRNNNVPAGR